MSELEFTKPGTDILELNPCTILQMTRINISPQFVCLKKLGQWGDIEIYTCTYAHTHMDCHLLFQNNLLHQGDWMEQHAVLTFRPCPLQFALQFTRFLAVKVIAVTVTASIPKPPALCFRRVKEPAYLIVGTTAAVFWLKT